MRALLLAALLAVSPALAIEQIGFNNTGSITGTTNYGSIVGTNVVDAQEVDRQCLVSSDIIIDELCVELTTAPAAGKQRVFTIRDDGSSDSDIQVTFTEGQSALECDTGSITISAGQTAGVLIDSTSLMASTSMRWWVRWHTLNDDDSIYCGVQVSDTMSDGGTLYHWVNGQQEEVQTSEFNTQMLAGGTCTGKRLYVKLKDAPGNTESRDFTISDNGSGTSDVGCLIENTATTCNDTSSTFDTTAGESISIKDVVSAGSVNTAGLFGFTLTCDREGEYVIATSAYDSYNNAATEYGEVQGASYIYDGTESRHNLPTPARYRIRKLYGEMGGAAGGLGSFVFTFRVAGADTDLAITMTSGTTVYSDTSTGIWPAHEADLTMKIAPSGGPTGTPQGHHSLLVRDLTYRRRY